jgi:hypothetical protein
MIIAICPICGKPIYLEDEKEYIECLDFKGFIHKNCPEEIIIKTPDCKEEKCNL